MPQTSSSLDRFLRALRRRLILVRAVEWCGLGIVVSAAFALILAMLLLLQGRGAMTLCIATLGIGAAAGFVLGIMRRPTLLVAAGEADRQLGLADLLATSLSAARSSDPWARSVVAIAQERCRTLTPADVIVSRLGGRAWGGIGLSAALVLCVGALSVFNASSETLAVGDAPAAVGSATRGGDEVMEQMVSARRRDAAMARSTDASTAARTPMQAARESAASPTGAADGRKGEDASAGGGAARTSVAETGSRPRLAARGNERLGDTVATGGAAGGAAGEQGHQRDATTSAGVQAAASGAWRAPEGGTAQKWARARQDARQAVQDGRVPDSSRDVVMEYFRGD